MCDAELLNMLMDAIDYAYLQVDGSYSKLLAYVVSDKMKFIKEQKDIKLKEEFERKYL